MRIVKLEQRSAEWDVWRKAGLGSSDAPVIAHGKHFDTTLLSLWQEKVGITQRAKRKANWAMEQGKLWEPRAIEWYEDLVGEACPSLCGLHQDHDWLRASFDGWCKGRPVEVKYARKEWHLLVLEEHKVPEEYTPQLLHQMLVSGVNKVTYVSVNPRFEEGRQFAVTTLYGEDEELKKLFDKELDFWNKIVNRVPPTEES